MSRIGAKVKSHLTGLGDTPHIEKLIGAVKLMLDAYTAGEIDAIHISYNHFVNTMKQEPCVEQLLPLERRADRDAPRATGIISTSRMPSR